MKSYFIWTFLALLVLSTTTAIASIKDTYQTLQKGADLDTTVAVNYNEKVPSVADSKETDNNNSEAAAKLTTDDQILSFSSKHIQKGLSSRCPPGYVRDRWDRCRPAIYSNFVAKKYDAYDHKLNNHNLAQATEEITSVRLSEQTDNNNPDTDAKLTTGDKMLFSPNIPGPKGISSEYPVVCSIVSNNCPPGYYCDYTERCRRFRPRNMTKSSNNPGAAEKLTTYETSLSSSSRPGPKEERCVTNCVECPRGYYCEYTDTCRRHENRTNNSSSEPEATAFEHYCTFSCNICLPGWYCDEYFQICIQDRL